jgi:hypothetical protein
MDELLVPEICVVCEGCREELPVEGGMQVDDVLLLHERRCAGQTAVCPACAADVTILAGLEVQEGLWMHADECAAALAS